MLFPRPELENFVQRYMGDRGRYIAALGTASLAYILETGILNERAGRFRRSFEEKLDRCSFYYAMKSNNHPRVAATLLAAGFGLDVSSGLELRVALDLGARDVIFSGPGKTDVELDLAVLHHERVTVLMDSFSELRRLEQVAASQNRLIRAGVRLTTNPSGLWKKFGIPLASLADFFLEAEQCPHIDLRGLQFHTSWNLTPAAQCEFIAALGGMLRTMPPASIDRIDFIDIGGGYWPEQGEWLRTDPEEDIALSHNANRSSPDPLVHHRLPATGIEVFAQELSATIQDHLKPVRACIICFEPGRWICNDAMHLLCTVVDKKMPDMAITDAGINAVGWDRFETDYFPVINLTRPSLEEKPCMVMGSLCTPHDVFGYSYFGSDIQPGDILMIPCQGAYTYSLHQTFIKPVPRVIAI